MIGFCHWSLTTAAFLLSHSTALSHQNALARRACMCIKHAHLTHRSCSFALLAHHTHSHFHAHLAPDSCAEAPVIAAATASGSRGSRSIGCSTSGSRCSSAGLDHAERTGAWSRGVGAGGLGPGGRAGVVALRARSLLPAGLTLKENGLLRGDRGSPRLGARVCVWEAKGLL